MAVLRRNSALAMSRGETFGIELSKDVIESPCPRPFDNNPDRLEQDLAVKPERPMVDVLHVQFHPVFKSYVTAAANLPETADARTDAETPPMPIAGEAFTVPHRQRSRS